MSVNQSDEQKALLSGKEEFDHSRYAIFIVIINLGLNFALYGYTNVMSTYFTSFLLFSSTTAGALTNTVSCLSYLVALLGGFVADTALGLFRTIVLGTVLFFFGMAMLCIANVVFVTVPLQYDTLFGVSVAGTILFLVGAGATKACTSAFLGEQFGPHQQQKRTSFYGWYYLSIQFGSIVVAIAAPIILNQVPWGAWTLFCILSGSFLIFFPIFLAGSRGFRKRPPQGSVYRTFFGIISAAWRNRYARTPEGHWLDPAAQEYDRESVEDVKTVLRVLVVFSPLPFFWAIFFQMYSVWVQQAQSMNTVVAGYTVPPSITITLNPLFDCFLIPFFDKVMYPLVDRVVRVTPLRKMAAGHVFTVGALVVAGGVEIAMTQAAPALLTVWWMVPQYFLVSCAEILLSVTVYELAYSQAPASMKGLVTGCMFFTIALGNAILAGLQLIGAARYIMNFAYAGGIAVVFVIFVIISINYQYREEN